MNIEFPTPPTGAHTLPLISSPPQKDTQPIPNIQTYATPRQHPNPHSRRTPTAETRGRKKRRREGRS